MAKQTLAVNIYIEGMRRTLAAFANLPKEANTELRDRSLKLSKNLTANIAAGARAEGSQAALMAPTVKAVRDRAPAIQAGGTRKVGRHKVSAWRILFASEFGMDIRSGWYHASKYDGSVGRQYKPHVGRGSYWFFRTVEEHEPEISREWRRAADKIVRAFAGDV